MSCESRIVAPKNARTTMISFLPCNFDIAARILLIMLVLESCDATTIMLATMTVVLLEKPLMAVLRSVTPKRTSRPTQNIPVRP